MDIDTTEMMNRLIDATIRIVQEHWDATNTAILLSTLGKRLSDDNINVREVLGKQKLGHLNAY